MLRLVAAQDFLADGGPGGAARRRDDAWRRSTGSTRRSGSSDGGELIERNVLRLERGLCFEVSIDAFAERVLALLDGERTLREVLVEAAAESEAPLTSSSTTRSR